MNWSTESLYIANLLNVSFNCCFDRAKKKIQKAQKKQKARIDLKMTIPGDQPTIQDDENMFDIKKIKNRTVSCMLIVDLYLKFA